MAQICEVLKYEGDNSTFIWKHPSEDFNSMTQLIVHESQEAIFFMNGQALDLFGPGRYTLETQNIPRIGGLLSRTTGDTTPFHCEVYFINKTVQMALKWGTDSKVRYLDPDFGIPIELGASGDMNLQVSDSRKLLVKLVGTMRGIAWEDRGPGFSKSLVACFRPLIVTAVKTNLSQAIKAGQYDILEVDEHLEELSAVLREKIVGGFEEYGLTIAQFYLTTIVFPDNDPNFKRLRELHSISLQTRMIRAEGTVRTAQAQMEAEVVAAQRQAELERQTTQTEIAKREAERKIIEAQAEAEKTRQAGYAEAQVMQAQGITKKDYVAAEVQKAYAEGLGHMGSGGGGSTMSDIIGLGVGMKAAGAVAGHIGGIFDGFGNNQTQANQPTQPEQPADDMAIFKAKVEKLSVMKEAGMISEEEFAQMKAKLLSDIL